MAGLEARVWRTQRFVSATSSVIHSGFIPSAGWRASSSSFPEALRLVSSIIASGSVGASVMVLLSHRDVWVSSGPDGSRPHVTATSEEGS